MNSWVTRGLLRALVAAPPLLFSVGCGGAGGGVYASDTYGPSFYDPYRADTGYWSSRYGLAPYREGFDFGPVRHSHR